MLMGPSIVEAMQQTVVAGLQRASVSTCSRWAEKYRVMGQPFPGNFSFTHHPWLRSIHDELGDLIGMKAAQMGYTETAMNKVFYTIDIKRQNCLYILPAANPDASDFTVTRFDPALELSPHLANLFSDVTNSRVKRSGSACLFIRGSRSRTQLKSIPAALIIFDEVAEMVQENISLAKERGSGQQSLTLWYLSTPTLPNMNIDRMFNESTQDHFFFRCPTCSKFTELPFFESLVITGDRLDDPNLKNSYAITQCGHALDFASKHLAMQTGEWVPKFPNASIRGVYINQLYSSMPPCHPAKIAEATIRAQTDPAAEQELWNSKGGLAHIVDGARLSDADFSSCAGTHKNGELAPNHLYKTMGIDVGKWFHYEIDAWHPREATGPDVNNRHRPQCIEFGKVKDVAELYDTIRKHGVHFVVIDGNPEGRVAKEFVKSLGGAARMCYYGNNVTKREMQDHPTEHYVTVDRTSWLDLSLGRYKNTDIILPANLNEEYQQNLKEPTRVYKNDAQGNPVGSYVGDGADHYAHARNYAEIAFAIAMNNGFLENIYG